MLPYRLLFNIGSKAVGTFMQRRQEKSQRKHDIAMREMATGNERGILAYAAFYGDMVMLQKVEFYFDKLKEIPEVYLYLIFIVVGGNYGISVTNLLTNKKFK